MIRFYYHQTPSEGGGGLVEFTDRINLSKGNVKFTTNAEQGSVGQNSFVVDDRNGDWSTHGHRKVLIFEDSAPEGNQLMFWGFMTSRVVRRGDVSEKVGVARVWEITLSDINTLIERRVMAGNDTDRPEENDVERVQWVVGTSEANAFDDVTTFVSTASPVNMSDSDYNGQGLASILDDCAQQSGKNFFLRWIWDDPDYVVGLWYGHDTVDELLTDVGVTNDFAQVDRVNVWLGSRDSRLELDPSRVFSGVFGNHDGGWVYETEPATETEFAKRDTVSSWPNVRKSARASARAERYLDDLDTEEEVVKTTILVTPEHVNDALHGDEIHVLFSHLPGYEEWRPVRVLNRTVTFLTPGIYKIDLELSENGPADGWVPPVIYSPAEECQVPLEGGLGLVPMRVNYGGAFNPSGGTGDSAVDYGEYCVLYGEATYAIHTFGATYIGPQPLTPMWSNLNSSVIYHGALGTTDCNFGPEIICPPLSERLDILTWPGDPGDPSDAIARMSFLPWTGHNPEGISWYVVISYISGPDPRFEGLVSCPTPALIP